MQLTSKMYRSKPWPIKIITIFVVVFYTLTLALFHKNDTAQRKILINPSETRVSSSLHYGNAKSDASHDKNECTRRYHLLDCNSSNHDGWPGRLGNQIVLYLSEYTAAFLDDSSLFLDENCRNDVLDLSSVKASGALLCNDAYPRHRIGTGDAFWLYAKGNNSLLDRPGEGVAHYKLSFPSEITCLYYNAVRPLLSYLTDKKMSEKLSQTVVVQVRSGDAYVPPEEQKGREAYLPPPLSYYMAAIDSFKDFKILVVTEQENMSPIIQSLRERYGSRLQVQTGSLLEDVGTFLNAPHVVLGQGTFAYSISMASPYLKSLHIFDNMVWTLDPIWNNVDIYIHRAPEYVYAMWPWLNLEEQVKLLFNFPEEKIQKQKLRRNIDCH